MSSCLPDASTEGSGYNCSIDQLFRQSKRPEDASHSDQVSQNRMGALLRLARCARKLAKNENEVCVIYHFK